MLLSAVIDVGMTECRRFRIAASAMLVMGLVAMLPVSGELSGEVRDVPSVRSVSRRFVIAAADSTDRMTLARWCDDIYTRFQDQWDPSPPLPRERVFGIVVASPSGVMPGGGIMHRIVSGPDAVFSLSVTDVSQLDAEAFAEAVCAMLLDALLLEAQPPEERGVFNESLPAWVAAGIAQNLYPALRNRNQAMVIDLWRSGQLPTSTQVLSWQSLPPHRVFEKAFSGVWMAWVLQHVPQRTALLGHWIGQQVEGVAIDAGNLFPLDEPVASSLGWEAYVASLQRFYSIDNLDGAALRYQRLRWALTVYPGVAGVPPDLEPVSESGLAGLLAWRRERWVRHFTRRRRAELAALAPTGDPDYQALLNRAMAFLDALHGRRPGFMLRREYASFLDELNDLETLALTREQYLSLFEQRLDPGQPAGAQDGLTRSRLRRYVDGFDKP